MAGSPGPTITLYAPGCVLASAARVLAELAAPGAGLGVGLQAPGVERRDGRLDHRDGLAGVEHPREPQLTEVGLLPLPDREVLAQPLGSGCVDGLDADAHVPARQEANADPAAVEGSSDHQVLPGALRPPHVPLLLVLLSHVGPFRPSRAACTALGLVGRAVRRWPPPVLGTPRHARSDARAPWRSGPRRPVPATR